MSNTITARFIPLAIEAASAELPTAALHIAHWAQTDEHEAAMKAVTTNVFTIRRARYATAFI
jgi:hypothetical protein